MKFLGLSILAIVVGVGCTTDGKYTWDDVVKDARGDNMQMRSGWGNSQTASDRSSSSVSNK